MKTTYRTACASPAGVVFLSPGGVRYRYSDRSDATRQKLQLVGERVERGSYRYAT